jgi:hypothetical protein
MIVVDRHYSDGWRQVEAPGPSRAWIDHSSSVLPEDQLAVSVAVDNYVGAGIALEQLLRLRPAQLMAVAHVQTELSERTFKCQWKVRVAGDVTVTGHGVDGRDYAELEQDVVVADVAGVQDHIDPGERRVNAGAQQAVCVGYEAEPDHSVTSRVRMLQS